VAESFGKAGSCTTLLPELLSHDRLDRQCPEKPAGNPIKWRQPARFHWTALRPVFLHRPENEFPSAGSTGVIGRTPAQHVSSGQKYYCPIVYFRVVVYRILVRRVIHGTAVSAGRYAAAGARGCFG